jgi:uncharacterized protein
MGWLAIAGNGQPAHRADRIRKGSPDMDELRRVDLTPAAADLLHKLTGQYGPLMFHQSGGCCDGSSPMCYPDGDLLLGDADVHLGDLAVAGLDRAVPFWMSVSQYEYWKHTHLTVDVVPGRGSGFSVEAPEGVRFLIRSRLMTDAELAHFQLA